MKTLICSSRIKTFFPELCLDYYLIKEKSREGIVYGIQITQHTPEGEQKESSRVHSMFTQREKAEDLCRLLGFHQVTPSSLQEIAEDWILSEDSRNVF